MRSNELSESAQVAKSNLAPASTESTVSSRALIAVAAYLILACLLAIVGVWLFSADEKVAGAALVGAAACLALVGLNELLRPAAINRLFLSPAITTVPEEEAKPGQANGGGLFAIVAAVWSSLAAAPASTAYGGVSGELSGPAAATGASTGLSSLVRSQVRTEVLIMAGLTVLAAVPRLWALGHVPVGLHGDEALTGLDALRIQSEGWIGPYVGSALGQPSGPLYWTALVLEFMHHTAYSVRLSMALLGIATVPLAYLMGRELFGREAGLIGAFLLAFMTWHLIFSRIAFLVISWPLAEVVVVALLFAALKSNRLVLYGLAGAALGLGIYTYNVYPIFVVAIGLFMIGQAVQSREWKQEAVRIACVFGAAFVTALPMLLYIARSTSTYFSHHRAFSVLIQDPFKQADLWGKLDILIDKAWSWLGSIAWSATPNAGEGSGAVPGLDPLSIVLILIGIAICVRTYRRPASQLVLLALVLIPVASVISVDPGLRRSLGLVPFLALLAALPLAYLWRSQFGSQAAQMAVRGGVCCILAAFAYINVDHYRATATSDFSDWVFAQEIAEASEYLHTLPGDPYVYFYSDRWGFNYETRLFLAPGLQGEDRSKNFGDRQGFDIDRSRDSVIVLLPPYIDDLPLVETLYPDGRAYVGEDSGRKLFAAYSIPAGSGGPPPAAGSDPAVAARDQDRRNDIVLIAQALEVYRDENGAYPSTDGQLQSACIYQELDVLCRLEPALDASTFVDARPEVGKYGYWYVSDGKEYALFVLYEDPALNGSCDSSFPPPPEEPTASCVASQR